MATGGPPESPPPRKKAAKKGAKKGGVKKPKKAAKKKAAAKKRAKSAPRLRAGRSPTWRDMVLDSVLATSKRRKAVSQTVIFTEIVGSYPAAVIDKDEKRVKKFFSKALKAAVEDGELIKEKASYLPRRA
jgi:hypothetical protein